MKTKNSWFSIGASTWFGAILLIFGLGWLPERVAGQGCVASRGAQCFIPGAHTHMESGIEAQLSYRWFRSDRHYVGDEEQTHREEEGSQVINNSNFIDVGMTYTINTRFSVSLTIPFSVHDRSQVVRSNDVQRTILQRFATQSSGIGDVRLVGYGWILDRLTHPKGNILLGVGFDAPTGEDDATDTFQVFDPVTGQIVARERTVDQSIQPGDGGWGIPLEIYAYQQLNSRLTLYLNGGYTITPEEDNGVPTFRTNPYESVMSIADSYVGRLGVDIVLVPTWELRGILGGRIDGVPVHDAVGGSDGFRRPGYAISIEPGLTFTRDGWMASLTTPVAIYRNRERSVPDEQLSEATGTYRHGDAAFADFSVLFSLGKRF